MTPPSKTIPCRNATLEKFHFLEAASSAKEQGLQERLQAMRDKYRRAKLSLAFEGFDIKENGYMDESEFWEVGNAMHRGGNGWSREQNHKAMRTFDNDGDGRVTREEFLSFYSGLMAHIDDLGFENGIRRFMAAAEACAKKNIANLLGRVETLAKEKEVLVDELIVQDTSIAAQLLKDQVKTLEAELANEKARNEELIATASLAEAASKQLTGEVAALEASLENARQGFETEKVELTAALVGSKDAVEELESMVASCREASNTVEREKRELGKKLEEATKASTDHEERFAKDVQALKEAMGQADGAEKLLEKQVTEAKRKQLMAEAKLAEALSSYEFEREQSRIEMLQNVYDNFDLDQSGELDVEEFFEISRAINVDKGWTREDHEKLLTELDVDGDHGVGKHEFLTYYRKAAKGESKQAFEKRMKLFSRASKAQSLKRIEMTHQEHKTTALAIRDARFIRGIKPFDTLNDNNIRKGELTDIFEVLCPADDADVLCEGFLGAGVTKCSIDAVVAHFRGLVFGDFDRLNPHEFDALLAKLFATARRSVETREEATRDEREQKRTEETQSRQKSQLRDILSVYATVALAADAGEGPDQAGGQSDMSVSTDIAKQLCGKLNPSWSHQDILAWLRGLVAEGLMTTASEEEEEDSKPSPPSPTRRQHQYVSSEAFTPFLDSSSVSPEAMDDTLRVINALSRSFLQHSVEGLKAEAASLRSEVQKQRLREKQLQTQLDAAQLKYEKELSMLKEEAAIQEEEFSAAGEALDVQKVEAAAAAAQVADHATEKHKLTEARVAKLEAAAAAMESELLAKLGDEEAMVAALEARKEELERQLVVLSETLRSKEASMAEEKKTLKATIAREVKVLAETQGTITGLQDSWKASKQAKKRLQSELATAQLDLKRLRDAALRQSKTDEDTHLAVEALESELDTLKTDREEDLVQRLANTLRQGATQLDLTDTLDSKEPAISFEDCEMTAEVIQGNDFDAKKHTLWLQGLQNQEAVSIDDFVERFTPIVAGQQDADSTLAQFSASVNARTRSKAEENRQWAEDKELERRTLLFEILFDTFDLLGDGAIDEEDFYQIGRHIHGDRWSKERNRESLKALDIHGGGTVEKKEFIAFYLQHFGDKDCSDTEFELAHARFSKAAQERITAQLKAAYAKQDSLEHELEELKEAAIALEQDRADCRQELADERQRDADAENRRTEELIQAENARETLKKAHKEMEERLGASTDGFEAEVAALQQDHLDLSKEKAALLRQLVAAEELVRSLQKQANAFKRDKEQLIAEHGKALLQMEDDLQKQSERCEEELVAMEEKCAKILERKAAAFEIEAEGRAKEMNAMENKHAQLERRCKNTEEAAESYKQSCVDVQEKWRLSLQEMDEHDTEHNNQRSQASSSIAQLGEKLRGITMELEVNRGALAAEQNKVAILKAELSELRTSHRQTELEAGFAAFCDSGFEDGVDKMDISGLDFWEIAKSLAAMAGGWSEKKQAAAMEKLCPGTSAVSLGETKTDGEQAKPDAKGGGKKGGGKKKSKKSGKKDAPSTPERNSPPTSPTISSPNREAYRDLAISKKDFIKFWHDLFASLDDDAFRFAMQTFSGDSKRRKIEKLDKETESHTAEKEHKALCEQRINRDQELIQALQYTVAQLHAQLAAEEAEHSKMLLQHRTQRFGSLFDMLDVHDKGKITNTDAVLDNVGVAIHVNGWEQEKASHTLPMDTNGDFVVDRDEFVNFFLRSTEGVAQSEYEHACARCNEVATANVNAAFGLAEEGFKTKIRGLGMKLVNAVVHERIMIRIAMSFSSMQLSWLSSMLAQSQNEVKQAATEVKSVRAAAEATSEKDRTSRLALALDVLDVGGLGFVRLEVLEVIAGSSRLVGRNTIQTRGKATVKEALDFYTGEMIALPEAQYDDAASRFEESVRKELLDTIKMLRLELDNARAELARNDKNDRSSRLAMVVGLLDIDGDGGVDLPVLESLGLDAQLVKKPLVTVGETKTDGEQAKPDAKGGGKKGGGKKKSKKKDAPKAPEPPPAPIVRSTSSPAKPPAPPAHPLLKRSKSKLEEASAGLEWGIFKTFLDGKKSPKKKNGPPSGGGGDGAGGEETPVHKGGNVKKPKAPSGKKKSNGPRLSTHDLLAHYQDELLHLEEGEFDEAMARLEDAAKDIIQIQLNLDPTGGSRTEGAASDGGGASYELWVTMLDTVKALQDQVAAVEGLSHDQMNAVQMESDKRLEEILGLRKRLKEMEELDQVNAKLGRDVRQEHEAATALQRDLDAKKHEFEAREAQWEDQKDQVCLLVLSTCTSALPPSPRFSHTVSPCFRSSLRIVCCR